MNKKMILILIFLLSDFVGLHVVSAKQPGSGHKPLQMITLDLQNMTCALCQYTIKKALLNVEGVTSVNVDVNSKSAVIRFDPQRTDVDALIKATGNAGYPSTVHPVTP